MTITQPTMESTPVIPLETVSTAIMPTCGCPPGQRVHTCDERRNGTVGITVHEYLVRCRCTRSGHQRWHEQPMARSVALAAYAALTMADHPAKLLHRVVITTEWESVY